MSDVSVHQYRVVLTPSPIQRIGAFALAALAEIEHPEELTPEQFTNVVEMMTQHLEVTADVAKAAEPGGFWLGVSYLLWPNSKINPTSRGKQLPEERREWIRQWRSWPVPTE
ncbi:hypothetical protein OHA40_30345 [Nocardia sp. NBC_00508]|uniref:hypothetical protein n=1 Tax=Nocardia sp. NBC_00508 TaxID=2975992 RepID=UPI002E8044C0|nr:hypothetical protein [Nocardia sp. NBC_00508]WUD65854.1 hypothetical protein OHA40_30345 [Nocardia sp. NBC_00508]